MAPRSVSLIVSLATYPALANIGGVAYVDANGSPLAIVRTSASTFVTLSRICPHQGGTVNAITTGFLCPNHHAQFDDQGRWVGGQPTGNLTTYPTTYDATSQSLTIG
jgi:Rieske Fe-S protein